MAKVVASTIGDAQNRTGQLEVFMTQWRRIEAVDFRPWPVHLAYFAQCDAPSLTGPLSFRHVGCDCKPAGRLVGGLAGIGGAWLQACSSTKLQREEAARQEQRRQAERTALLQDRRRILARRYLFQLGDAVDFPPAQG